MDPNVNPEPKPHHHDIAEPGPIDPATGQPDREAEVSAVKSWLRQNSFSLLFTIAGVVAVCYFWDPFTAMKVALGLGFIIFIHELGHFLAAKWCDVHVKTFSIGFGPSIPFCSYKWGETTYMLGVIPLGGYVSMVGEGTGESTPDGDPDDDDNDPRSFKNKPVRNRMLIISAGVIMNIIFGMCCFVAAYMHGVKEEPAVVGAVFSGGAAWRADLRSGDEIVQIGSRDNPTFKDLRPVVMSSDKGERVPIVVRRNGKDIALEVMPIRDEGTYFPQLGVQTTSRLTLYEPPKKSSDTKPVIPGSKAAEAKEPFLAGDRIVGMTDPAKPESIAPVQTYAEYHKRMVELAGRPVTFAVLRKDDAETAKPVEIAVQPSYRANLGMRMQIGKVSAIRNGSPAEKAVVEAVSLDDGPNGRGDRIAAVGIVETNGKRTWLANGARPPEAKDGDAVRPLDPILLPQELRRWAATHPSDRKVDLVVLRETEAEHKEQRKLLVLEYDDSYSFDRDVLPLPNSPVAVDGLGLAYWVTGVVNDVEPDSPAGKAGVKPNDVVDAVMWDTKPKDLSWFQRLIGTSPEKWDEVKPHQWAYVESILRTQFAEVKLRLKRGDETVEVSLTGVEDKNWPSDERGLLLQSDTREQKAADLGDAVRLGARRTVRFIKEIYINLYGYLRGRISVKTMSGPLMIANVSYKIAGEDLWQFLLFLGVISVNLAVVNFLPIPVLDGGHMVFLIYEKITGRPLPERLFAALMWIGLAMILSLFIFVISRDILALYF